MFEPADVDETTKLNVELKKADRILDMTQGITGASGPEGWAEHCEEAMTASKTIKKGTLADPEVSEEERAQTAAHWPFDDRDEEEYM
ncbi:hypothetical protein H0H92_006914 [Tricholoma furcatifolium]|nr:hypothetical protein H0H92_006914 [Tricholoma furcatifolium]